jgi:hypothetical protein
MSIQSDKAPNNLASVWNFSLQTTLPNRVSGFASQNFEFPLFSPKSVCFCEAATRHEGQYDTTAIF